MDWRWRREYDVAEVLNLLDNKTCITDFMPIPGEPDGGVGWEGDAVIDGTVMNRLDPIKEAVSAI